VDLRKSGAHGEPGDDRTAEEVDDYEDGMSDFFEAPDEVEPLQSSPGQPTEGFFRPDARDDRLRGPWRRTSDSSKTRKSEGERERRAQLD
jgi:hypothetical protein